MLKKMKKNLLIAFAFSAFALQAQHSFSGLRNSPFMGVYNATSNPGNLVDGMKKWHVNLVSFDANFSNNVVPITTSLTNDLKEYTKTDLTNPIFANNDIKAAINTDILGPSFTFHIGDKNAIAVTSRSRILADIRDIDAKVIESYISSVDKLDLATYPKIQLDNQSVTLNAFSEVGLSFARVLFKTDNHTLKAGATLKYVSGAISTYAGFADFSGEAKIEQLNNNDVILKVEGSGEFVVNNGGVDLMKKDLSVMDFTNSNASGVGVDLGLVYEFRFEPCPTCVQAPYDIKLGASVTDLGKLKYTLSNNSRSYAITTGATPMVFNLNNLQESLEAIPSSLVVETSNAGKEVTASLPTVFRLYADARVWGKLFVDFEGQFDMTSKSDLHKASYKNAFVITPRFEGRALGIYLPIANTSQVGTSIGAAVRLGPLVIGSNTIVSNLATKNAKALNVFFGLQFGR